MSSRKFITAIVFAALASISFVDAQVVNPGVQQSGNVTVGHCTKWGPGIGQVSDAGAACASAPPSGANPTATAGPTAINGSAATYMRSDAAPAIQLGTNAQKGLIQGDGTTVTCAAGVCSAAVVSPANPSAVAGPAAINGAATTYMRSDAAPAIQLGTNAQKGLVQGDGTTVTCAAGVCSAVISGANPSATAGPTAINGTATTYMRSDAAPAIQLGTNAVQGLVRGDGTSVSCTAGVCSSAAVTPPTTQSFLSGSGTYTTPANTRYIRIKMIGGGAGGTGGAGGASGAGGATCWNASGAACTSPLLSAGGAPAGAASTMNAGGTCAGSLTPYLSVTGGSGGQGPNANVNGPGGMGGQGFFGGGGNGGVQGGGGGGAAVPNTGGGGGGGGGTGSNTPGSGGGAGCYLEAQINSPAATYVYAVGAGGTSGTGSPGGGAGASGRILIEEYH